MSVLLHWQRKLEKAIKNLNKNVNIEIAYKSFKLMPDAPLEPNGIGYEVFSRSKGVSIHNISTIVSRLPSCTVNLPNKLNLFIITPP